MEQNSIERKLICYKCNAQLVKTKVDFTYLGKAFHADVLKCPVCRKVCITRDLAEGKMADVEHLLEEK